MSEQSKGAALENADCCYDASSYKAFTSFACALNPQTNLDTVLVRKYALLMMLTINSMFHDIIFIACRLINNNSSSGHTFLRPDSYVLRCTF